MSEKRFALTNPISHNPIPNWVMIVHDDVEHKHMNAEEIVDLLNSLVDENEQLRQELNDCEKFRHSVFKRMNELTDQLKEKEEDEKLYAEEILKLREINEFNELGGDY